jgi:hypothetical protein
MTLVMIAGANGGAVVTIMSSSNRNKNIWFFFHNVVATDTKTSRGRH